MVSPIPVAEEVAKVWAEEVRPFKEVTPPPPTPQFSPTEVSCPETTSTQPSVRAVAYRFVAVREPVIRAFPVTWSGWVGVGVLIPRFVPVKTRFAEVVMGLVLSPRRSRCCGKVVVPVPP